MTSMPSRRDYLKSSGCVVLFGLPFAAVGTFMGWMAVSTVWRSYEMSSWTEVPATILEARLESHAGDDSTTYSVKARYRYELDGRSYESTRVSLHGGSDNIGHYHQKLARILESHLVSGEPYPCFVDPRDPSQAILDRRPRWGMVGFYSVFLLTFGGVGWALIVGAIVSWRDRPRVETKEAEQPSDPERPWLRRDDWAEGLVRYSDRGPAFGMLIFAMLWNLISAPVLFLVPEEIEKGNLAALLGLVFPLVGAGFVVWVVRGMLRWRRYGESTLYLDHVPVAVGGVLEGRVEIESRVEPVAGFEWTLSCVRKRRKTSGNESSSEQVAWQDRGRASYERRGGLGAKTVIPLRLDLPADEAGTRAAEEGGEEILWRLDLEADVEGIDYLGRFELPVFEVASAPARLAAALSAVAAQAAPRPAGSPAATGAAWESLPPAPAVSAVRPEDLEAHGVRVRPLASGGYRFYLPMARQLGTALSVTFFWLLWNGAIVLMVKAGAPWFFPVIFGAFSLLITYSLLEFWFGACAIEADRDGVRLSTTILGVGRRAEIPAAEVEAVEVEKGMQSGSRLFYRVFVRTAAGNKRVAATRLPGRRPAVELKAAMEAALER